MGMGSGKAGTQDSVSGTPYPTGINAAGGPSVPLSGLIGNKTTWSESPTRTGVTAQDTPTGGDLTTTGFAGTSGANLISIENALAVTVRATCNTASKTLTGRVVFYDGSNNPIAISRTLSFTSDATLRLGNASGDFVCQPDAVDAHASVKFRFIVDSVSGGTWAIYARGI